MPPGDIYLIELPTSDGHEQSGRRPAVILQDDTYAANSPLVFAVPLTTAVATLRFPGTLLIEPTEENGLAQPSVALVFQLRAVDRRRLRNKIGIVNSEVLATIYGNLDRLMGRVSS